MLAPLSDDEVAVLANADAAEGEVATLVAQGRGRVLRGEASEPAAEAEEAAAEAAEPAAEVEAAARPRRGS